MFRTLKLGGRAGVSLEEQLLEKQYRAGPRGEWPLSSGSGEPRSCAAGRWLLVAPLCVMQGPESRHQNRRLQGRATCGSPPATSCPAFCLLTPTKLMSPFSGLSALKKKKIKHHYDDCSQEKRKHVLCLPLPSRSCASEWPNLSDSRTSGALRSGMFSFVASAAIGGRVGRRLNGSLEGQ